MAKDNEYWQRRYLKLKADAVTDGDAYERSMRRRLAPARKEIENAINGFIERYALEDGTLDPIKTKQQLNGVELKNWHNTLDQWQEKAVKGGYDKELNLEYYRSRVSRIKTLEAQMASVMAEHAAKENPTLSNKLASTYANTYYRTLYTHQQQTGQISANFARFDDKELKRIVAKPWAGSTFSKRVWDNYTRSLPQMLTETLSRGVVLGYSPDKLVKSVRLKYADVSTSSLHRLINTEMAHITEEATFDAYNEDGVEQYEYIAALESHTCDECRMLDGQHFKVKEKKDGVNYPVIHPNCRCTTGAYYPEAELIKNRTRSAVDPKTGKSVTVGDMNYNEWANSVGLKQVTPATTVTKTEKVVAEVVKTSAALDKTNMKEMVGDANYTKFADHLDNLAEDKQKALYQLAGDEISFAKMVKSNDYAVRDVVHISQSSFDGKSGFKNPLSTVYHENAHAIDSVVGKHLSKKFGYEVDKISTMNEYDLKTVIDNDFKNYIFKDLEEVKKPRRNSKDFATKYDAYLEYLDEKRNRLNAFKSEMKQIKESKSNVSAMSDMMEAFGAFGDFPLGSGHGHQYWKTLGKQESEFFAEVSEIINVDNDQYELIKKVLPNAVGKYHEIIDDAINTMAEVKGGN